jgi:polyisoprenyl-phosphate glycosyltransferase
MITRLAIVSPVLDDWASFETLISEISNEFTGSGITLYFYAVDDGSLTGTDLRNLELSRDTCIAQIEIIHLAVNLGHQRAIAIGLCEIVDCQEIDAVVVMDCDGEDRPADIGVLLEAARLYPGEIVLAERTKRSETLGFRIGYFVYKLLFRTLTGRTMNFGNYLLLPMPAVRRLVHLPELWNHLAASVIRSRLPYRTVPTIRGVRYHGRSTMNLVSLIVHGLSAMSVHTDRIFVRLLLGASLIALLSGVGIAVVIAIRFTTDLAIPGWATTVVGDLLIILSQAFFTVIATSLIILAGRSGRPIIPVADCRPFISQRELWQADQIRKSTNSQTGL